MTLWVPAFVYEAESQTQFQCWGLSDTEEKDDIRSQHSEMKAKLMFCNPFSEARITLRQKPEKDDNDVKSLMSFRSEEEKSSENIGKSNPTIYKHKHTPWASEV